MNLRPIALETLLADIAARTPTPGGGAVACLTGAAAAALGSMVVAYSIGKKNLAEHQPALAAAAAALESFRSTFLTLAEDDARAYGEMNDLMRLPEDDPRRVRDYPAAVRAAADAPARAVQASVDLLTLLASLPGVTNRHLRSDLASAAVLAEAAARASRWNVVVNAPSLDAVAPGEGRRLLDSADERTARARIIAAAVESACG